MSSSAEGVWSSPTMGQERKPGEEGLDFTMSTTSFPTMFSMSVVFLCVPLDSLSQFPPERGRGTRAASFILKVFTARPLAKTLRCSRVGHSLLTWQPGCGQPSWIEAPEPSEDSPLLWNSAPRSVGKGVAGVGIRRPHQPGPSRSATY